MKAIALSRYLSTDVSNIFDMSRFVTRSSFQMPKLRHSTCKILIRNQILSLELECTRISIDNRICKLSHLNHLPLKILKFINKLTKNS